MDSDTQEKLLRLADTCMVLSEKPRPEVLWLQEKFERLQKNNELKSKIDADRLVFERMYGHPPEKISNMLKIRYWRTGRSTPSNRAQCLLLAEALELSETERKDMLHGWCDLSTDCYSEQSVLREDFYEGRPADACLDCRVHNESFSRDNLYEKRCVYLEKLTRHYLCSVPNSHLESLRIPRGRAAAYLRHIYFTDSLHYVHLPNVDRKVFLRHISSINFNSEFMRQSKLLGEIPRKTMIRHLLIMGLPELTRTDLDRGLALLGYLPLSEEHTMTGGERLDWLLIRLLDLYEEVCSSTDAEERLAWFQEACRILDACFAERGHERLRFMHFKAQDL